MHIIQIIIFFGCVCQPEGISTKLVLFLYNHPLNEETQKK
jgi:hypothetical protein